jgi:hypothetical protein
LLTWRKTVGNRVAGRLLALVVVVALGLVPACGQQTGSVQTVEAFLAALEAFDIEKAQSLVCESQQESVLGVLEPFGNVSGMTEAFNMAFDDIQVTERALEGDMALVHISGNVTISFLGQQERQAVDEEHVLVKENGRWVICDP